MRVTFEGTVHEVLDQIEAFTKGIIDQWSKPLPQKRFKRKVEIEQPIVDDSDPVPISEEKPEVVVPEDLLGAVMALVNGDKEKKVRLVEMLGKYDAKTIGALAPEYRAEFWLQAQDL